MRTALLAALGGLLLGYAIALPGFQWWLSGTAGGVWALGFWLAATQEPGS